jgi:ribonuclease P protein component
VVRNRIKRRIREAFRLHRAELGPWDIVLNPRRAVFHAAFDEIERALGKVMQRCSSC